MLELRNVELGMEKIKAVVEFTNENYKEAAMKSLAWDLRGGFLA